MKDYTLSEPSYLLSIDNGTQSVRALLFDTQGNLLAKGKVELDPYFSSQPGWAEQDPEYYWASLGEACRLLWQQVDIDRSQIKGVAVTTPSAAASSMSTSRARRCARRFSGSISAVPRW